MRATRFRVNIIRFLLGGIILYILLRLFVYDIYFIRSSSMRSTLLEGDYVLVNKFFLNEPDRYEVTVFQPPAPDSAFGDIDSYIKRCIGLPGDTVLIEKGKLFVNSVASVIPGLQFNYSIITNGSNLTEKVLNRLGIERGSALPGGKAYTIFMTDPAADSIRVEEGILSVNKVLDEPSYFDENIFPFNPELKWNLDNFGPVYVPKEGDSISLDRVTFLLYSGIINVFEQRVLEKKDSLYLLDGKKCTSYTFLNDYYFMMGDNRHFSSDSRVWGFVPESHINGTSALILWSTDPNTDLSRDGRSLKAIQ